MRSAFAVLLAAAAVAASAQSHMNVWPAPVLGTIATPGSQVSLSPDFVVRCSGKCAAPLPEAIQRYQSKLFFVAGAPTSVASNHIVSSCSLQVADDVKLVNGVRAQASRIVPDAVHFRKFRRLMNLTPSKSAALIAISLPKPNGVL